MVAMPRSIVQLTSTPPIVFFDIDVVGARAPYSALKCMGIHVDMRVNMCGALHIASAHLYDVLFFVARASLILVTSLILDPNHP